jgi:fatty-acyl-CoA synthase
MELQNGLQNELQSVHDGVDYAAITMGDLLERIAARHPARDAVVTLPSPSAGDAAPVRLSYADLAARARLAARGLIALGVQPGDRVAIWATNVPEYVVLQFAVPMAGAVWVTINIRSLANEVEYLLNRSESVALCLVSGFRDFDYLESIRQVAPRLPALRHQIHLPRPGEPAPPDGMLSFERLLELGRQVDDRALDERMRRVQPTDTASIQFTSGTTGFPKGVMLSHRNMVLNAHHTALAQRISERDRFVVMGPLFHCAPNVLGSLCAVTRGAAMVLVESFDPAVVLDAVEREGVTVINGAPTMFVQLLGQPDVARRDLASLRTGFMASAPCPIELMREVIERLGVAEFTICYGLTETSPLITHTGVDAPLERRVSTVGRALPGVEIRIVDPATSQDVPTGQSGELWARGYVVMQGYFRDPEATAGTIVEGGWCRTGDLASIDAEGWVNIRGRLKDVIIRGGENIAPTEVENVLYEHPSVKEAAVVGVPSQKWGEEVGAFVMLKPGAAATPDELRDFCLKRLAYYKAPRHVFLVDQLPAVASGKIQKFKLREDAIRRLGLEQVAAIKTA